MHLGSLQDLLSPAVAALGFELWGYEYLPAGKHSVLRVYIESPNGISIDDCQAVSRQIEAVLAVEEALQGAYQLEVSSPGLDRLLFNEQQFEQSIGKKIHLKLKQPQEGQRHFTGILKSVSGGCIVLEASEGLQEIALNNVQQARWVY